MAIERNEINLAKVGRVVDLYSSFNGMTINLIREFGADLVHCAHASTGSLSYDRSALQLKDIVRLLKMAFEIAFEQGKEAGWLEGACVVEPEGYQEQPEIHWKKTRSMGRQERLTIPPYTIHNTYVYEVETPTGWTLTDPFPEIPVNGPTLDDMGGYPTPPQGLWNQIREGSQRHTNALDRMQDRDSQQEFIQSRIRGNFERLTEPRYPIESIDPVNPPAVTDNERISNSDLATMWGNGSRRRTRRDRPGDLLYGTINPGGLGIFNPADMLSEGIPPTIQADNIISITRTGPTLPDDPLPEIPLDEDGYIPTPPDSLPF